MPCFDDFDFGMCKFWRHLAQRILRNRSLFKANCSSRGTRTKNCFCASKTSGKGTLAHMRVWTTVNQSPTQQTSKTPRNTPVACVGGRPLRHGFCFVEQREKNRENENENKTHKVCKTKAQGAFFAPGTLQHLVYPSLLSGLATSAKMALRSSASVLKQVATKNNRTLLPTPSSSIHLTDLVKQMMLGQHPTNLQSWKFRICSMLCHPRFIPSRFSYRPYASF